MHCMDRIYNNVLTLECPWTYLHERSEGGERDVPHHLTSNIYLSESVNKMVLVIKLCIVFFTFSSVMENPFT